MNAEYKRLTIQFTSEIKMKMAELIERAFLDTEQHVSDLLNLVMSVHFSSMFTLMDVISEEHPEINKKVILFIEDLKKTISKQNHIESLCVMTSR